MFVSVNDLFNTIKFNNNNQSGRKTISAWQTNTDTKHLKVCFISTTVISWLRE